MFNPRNTPQQRLIDAVLKGDIQAFDEEVKQGVDVFSSVELDDEEYDGTEREFEHHRAYKPINVALMFIKNSNVQKDPALQEKHLAMLEHVLTATHGRYTNAIIAGIVDSTDFSFSSPQALALAKKTIMAVTKLGADVDVTFPAGSAQSGRLVREFLHEKAAGWRAKIEEKQALLATQPVQEAAALNEQWQDVVKELDGIAYFMKDISTHHKDRATGDYNTPAKRIELQGIEADRQASHAGGRGGHY